MIERLRRPLGRDFLLDIAALLPGNHSSISRTFSRNNSATESFDSFAPAHSASRLNPSMSLAPLRLHSPAGNFMLVASNRVGAIFSTKQEKNDENRASCVECTGHFLRSAADNRRCEPHWYELTFRCCSDFRNHRPSSRAITASVMAGDEEHDVRDQSRG